MMAEIAKLRRTRTLLLGVLLSSGIALFACMNLFGGGRIGDFAAGPYTSWASHLIGFSMAEAFLGPLQLALIASRVVDAEHASGGWRLNAIAGIRPGELVTRKLAVAGLIVFCLKLLEFGVVAGLPILLGAPTPDLNLLGTWIRFTIGVAGTSFALLAVMLWLAAVVDSQITVLAAGVVGGFLGIAALLSPAWLASVNPFGSIALLTPFAFSDNGVVATSPHWLLWTAHLVVAGVLFAVGTRALNRKEV